jgi:hypothetical protein
MRPAGVAGPLFVSLPNKNNQQSVILLPS